MHQLACRDAGSIPAAAQRFLRCESPPLSYSVRGGRVWLPRLIPLLEVQQVEGNPIWSERYINKYSEERASRRTVRKTDREEG